MQNVGFIVVDLEGPILSAEEREILQHPTVAGIILFSRNYEEPTQLRALTTAIKKSRDDLLIAVDQEGGRVQRFRQGFTELPSMGHYGQMLQQSPEQAKQQLRQTITTAAKELKSAGINVNLAPVLDIDQNRNEVIGARSFGHDPASVITLGKVAIDAMHAAQMPAVGKHFPGHGGVTGDSHQTLPCDERAREAIRINDLLPFISLLSDLDAIMPAHVIYSAFDANPACFSRYWLTDVLRREFDFNGVVISDDLSMLGAAAMGSYADRAMLALEAGCDLLSICNNRAGAVTVIDALANYQNHESSARIHQFISKYCVTTKRGN
jgi:beta-N-acetylhexosaminidase